MKIREYLTETLKVGSYVKMKKTTFLWDKKGDHIFKIYKKEKENGVWYYYVMMHPDDPVWSHKTDERYPENDLILVKGK